MSKLSNIFIGVALAATALTATAQQYPTKTVTFASAMAAGSSTDILARETAKFLNDRLGQSVVVEVVAGAGGNIAAQKVVNAAPDGYTLLFVTNGVISNQAMRSKPPFDITKELVIISPLFEGIFGLFVNPNVPAKTVNELIAHAKANPGKLNYGTSGIGGIVHLVNAEFAERAGINIVHVPYKGGAEYMPATIANQVQMNFADVSFAKPQVDAGKVRALAVSSKQRLASMPDVPTFEESGPAFAGYTPTFWMGLYAPKGTPQAIIDRLNAEVRAFVTPADARARYAARGYQTVWLPPADAQKRVNDELAQYNKIIDAVKIERQ
jgi:tripartite-type tricarboxylate transporter receptor subunit TctC